MPEGDISSLEVLLVQIALGNRAAFAALYRSTSSRLFGICLRVLTQRSEAEDALQDVYTAVWRKAAQFDASRASVSTWIYTIARNVRIDRLRHERGASAEALYDVLRGDDPDQPDDLLQGAERHDRIRAAMDELPDEQKTVVHMSFFEDKPHGDIARILGIPLGTVKSRLRLALAKLRERSDELS